MTGNSGFEPPTVARWQMWAGDLDGMVHTLKKAGYNDAQIQDFQWMNVDYAPMSGAVPPKGPDDVFRPDPTFKVAQVSAVAGMAIAVAAGFWMAIRG